MRSTPTEHDLSHQTIIFITSNILELINKKELFRELALEYGMAFQHQ